MKLLSYMLLCLGLLSLSSCANRDPEQNVAETAERTKIIVKPTYQITLPTSWREIHPSQISGEYFSSLNIKSLFYNEEKNIGEENIYIAVTKEDVKKDYSALEFFLGTIQSERAAFFDYSLLEQKNLNISGQPTRIIKFTARVKPELSLLYYWQILLVKNSTLFAFTAGTPEGNREKTEIEISKILTSILLQ